MQADPTPGGVIALLGPTNTGKTHRAIERMLDHETGMIGLPLRLLAREVYDRVAARVGPDAVALVTGEEKLVPPRARYWICTVEAMPRDQSVGFVAIDEIQLAADRERGHVFTDRMLRCRGLEETWLLGAETIRPLLAQLVPEAQVRRHPRLSELRAADPSSLGGLPKRSAVVAFSMNSVYEIAERLRQRRGGAAVVLGALSPRARNAQVAMYQAGEVDYLVATDAIGMGLNLDLTHVAFAELRKFDGREARPLEAAELAQIAGRAGRHVRDGSFGTLRGGPALSPSILRAIEQHRFEAARQLFWRNPALDFHSVDDLLASLSLGPSQQGLRQADQAEDHATLVELARRPEIRCALQGPPEVELLWEACQIPDYRQLMLTHHANLVAEIFSELAGPRRCLSADFMHARLSRLARYEGDIDTLMGRMAFVRTWTYVTNHGRWVERAAEFRQLARDIEDRLSDALHAKLVERFVLQRARRGSARPAAPEKSHPFWALEQLKQEWFGGAPPPQANEGMRLQLDEQGRLLDADRPVAQLVRGNHVLSPALRLLEPDEGRGGRDALSETLASWIRDRVQELLAPCRPAEEAEASAHLTGLLYAMRQSLGCAASTDVRVQLEHLTDVDRAILVHRHIAVDKHHVYATRRLKPGHLRLRAALWQAYHGNLPFTLPNSGALCFAIDRQVPAATLVALCHPRVGPVAIRVDMVDRVRALPREADAVKQAQQLLGIKRKLAEDLLRTRMPRRRPARSRRRP
ncbi:MAG: helicase-related protein [Polyangiaceae bacterium]